MNYYDQLYDVNFLSSDSYKAENNSTSVSILSSGEPDWSTWKSKALSVEDAARLWQDFRTREGSWFQREFFRVSLTSRDRDLLFLILCEDAYRNFVSADFIWLSRFLLISESKDLKLRALKLQYAWLALLALFGSDRPLQEIINFCTKYVSERGDLGQVSFSNVKVEDPVRYDWQKRCVSHTDQHTVTTFYQETFSYILELTAANHQVETLFNYSILLEMLKCMGVKEILDYGAGIGTLLLLAHQLGFRGIYADIESETNDFAHARFQALGVHMPSIKLDPYAHELPDNLDCIVCTEVLEHIFEPELLVKNIYRSLKRGGCLVVSESFDYIDNFCSHLPMHKGKGGRAFLHFLKEMGFKQVETNFHIHPTIHVKV